MRKTLGVCLLVLLLTSSAGAGIMPNESPAPSQQTSVAEESAADSLTQVVLDLLAALL
jgi:hypothetical protein